MIFGRFGWVSCCPGRWRRLWGCGRLAALARSRVGRGCWLGCGGSFRRWVSGGGRGRWCGGGGGGLGGWRGGSVGGGWGGCGRAGGEGGGEGEGVRGWRDRVEQLAATFDVQGVVDMSQRVEQLVELG